MQHTVSSAGRKKWYCLHVSVGEMMRTQTRVSRNCSDEWGEMRDDPPACWWLDSTRVAKEKSKVDEFMLHFWTTTRLLPERIRPLPAASGRPPWCNDFHDRVIARWSPPSRRLTTNSDRSSLLPPRHHPHPKKNPHVKWKAIWKLKATMRGRMTVLQFRVILTVKSQIHHHSLLTLPLSTYSGYEGRRQDPNGSVTAHALGSTRHCLLDRDLRHPRTPESGSSAAPSRGAHRF